MRVPLFLLMVFCIVVAPASGQTIFPRGIVHAASYVPQGLPGGGIAQGSLFSIFGKNLGPTASPPLAFPLSTTLGGVSVKVYQGGASVDAIPVFVSPGQVNAIMPSNAPLGMVSVRVTYGGSTGNPSPVRVVNSSFGTFAVNSAGLGPGIMQNYVSATEQPLNSTRSPAKPGDVVTLYGTGLGAISAPDNLAPPAGDLDVSTEVSVGGQSAAILYHGRSPCCSALDQIVFRVPDSAPQGCWVPVYVRTRNTTTSNVVTMAISATGAACSDPNPAVRKFAEGGRVGAVVALRSTIREDIGTLAPVDVTTEFLGSLGSSESGGPFAFNPFLSLPPAGSCTVYTAAGDLFGIAGALPASITSGRLLKMGSSFTLTGPAGRSTPAPLFQEPANLAMLGFSVTGWTGTPTLLLNPGSFAIAANGGADVPAFSAQVDIPAALNWTNRDQATTIDRSQPLTAAWSGAPAGSNVSVAGGAVDLPTNSSALFLCVAPVGATSFTVPAAVLSALPPSRPLASQTKAVLFVGTLPMGNSSVFTASGLDTAVMLPVFLSGRTVAFR